MQCKFPLLPLSFKGTLIFSGHITSLGFEVLDSNCLHTALASFVFPRQPCSGSEEICILFDTYVPHATLLAASFNKHQIPLTRSIFTVNTHTHCHNADLLSSCLRNGWVEWAGAHSDGSCVAVLLWGAIIPAASPPYS